MSGPIPDATRAKMAAMPPEWKPAIHEDQDRIWWQANVTSHIGTSVQQIPVEYGFSKRTGKGRSVLRATAWEISELARLGRLDLIQYARKDRHQARPGPKATITEQNTGQSPTD